MKHTNIRLWHRRLGIALAIFIVLQGGSGLLITISEGDVDHSHVDAQHGHEIQEMVTAHEDHSGESSLHDFLGYIHHGTGVFMSIYRVLLGLGLIVQTVLGVVIFWMVKKNRA